jgi:serine phosphatase RsbU (regulator of sigma subunit)
VAHLALVLGLPGLPAGPDGDGPSAVEVVTEGAEDGRAPEVVVIGSDVLDPLAALRSAHGAHPDAAAVVVVPPGDPGDVRRRLTYTPGVPADLAVVPVDDVPALHQAVLAGAVRTARHRHHRQVLSSVRARPHDPAPTIRPSAESLATVLDQSPLGVAVLDPEGRTLTWNARAEALLLLTPQDRERPLAQLLDEPAAVSEAVRASSSYSFSTVVTAGAVRAPGTAVEVNAAATLLDDGRPAVLVLLLDVSGRHAAERAREALEGRLAVARRSQEFLLEASDVLAGATDYADTLEQLARIAVPRLGDLCLIDVVDRGRFRREAARHADPALQPVADVLMAHPPSMDGEHPAAEAVRDGRTRWAAELPDDRLRATTHDDEHLAAVRRLRFRSFITVPLAASGELLGVVTVVACGDTPPFGPDDVALVEELAGRVAQVVLKARRYDREHEIAVALQRSMLTALPDLGAVEVAARYVPAQRDIQVGGDWYDAFVPEDGSPVLVIGDVVGHDLAAATVMGQVRNALRALAWGRSDRPADVLTALDAFNGALRMTDFATVLYGVLEGDDGGGTRFRWSNAGHLPPLLVTADGEARFLRDVRDLVIGVGLGGAVTRREACTVLPPGSTVLLYTDGLVERRGHHLTEGLEALRAVACGLAGRPLGALCDEILAALAGDREDDVALLAVRVP